MRSQGWLEVALLVVCLTNTGCAGQQKDVLSGKYVQAETEIETRTEAGVGTTELLETAVQANGATIAEDTKHPMEDAAETTGSLEFSTRETEVTVSSGDAPEQMEILTIEGPVFTGGFQPQDLV